MHRFTPIEEEEPQSRWRTIRLLACRSRADDAEDLLDRCEFGNPYVRSSFSKLEGEVSKKRSLGKEDSPQSSRYERNKLPLSPDDLLKRVLDGDTAEDIDLTQDDNEERPSVTEESLPFRDNPRDFASLINIPVHRCESPSGTSQPPIPCRELTVLATDRQPPTAHRMLKYSMLPPPKLSHHSRRQKLRGRIEGHPKLTKGEEREGKQGVFVAIEKPPRGNPSESAITRQSDLRQPMITDKSCLWETTLDTSREWWKPQADITEPLASRSDDSSEHRERREPPSNPGTSIMEEVSDSRESTGILDKFDSRQGPFNHSVARGTAPIAKPGHLRYQRWSTLAENQDKKSSPTFQAHRKALHKPKAAVYDVISSSNGNPEGNGSSYRAHGQNSVDKIPPANQTWNRTWVKPTLERPSRGQISGPTGQYKITVTTIRASESTGQSS